MLQYHHCRDLESVVFGEVKGNPKYSDPIFRKAYFWLKKEVGFYPLFLAVGSSEDSLHMTGYQDQWRRVIGTENVGRRKDGRYIQKNVLRHTHPNYVLFSFENIEGVFMDFDFWHLALNAAMNRRDVSEYEKRLIFKPSWTKSRWLRKAEEHPDTVQLVSPKIYLPDAKRILVRNQETAKTLELMGFENIEVRRLVFTGY